MCGIVGFVDTQVGADSERRNTVRTMANALRHRGPDANGVWVEHPAALGHRRLSIIDLSPQGQQPMVSACGRYVLSFNGEIYSYQHLRRQLEQEGVAPRWRGNSDSEVLLAALALWGVAKTLPRLTGMFALALWDRLQRRLVLARDRFGEKPLYYGWQGHSLLFGSELKALRPHPAWRDGARIDRASLCQFLRHGYIPAPRSIYEQMQKLTPGCYLELSFAHSSGPFPLPTPIPYWSPHTLAETGDAHPFTGDPTSALTELENRLSAAITGQMVADVPLGAFLSGGIDSSLVVSLMQRLSSQPVRTFAIGFSEQAFNEADHARAVAQHLGTQHHEQIVTPDEALAVIPQLPTLYDEPFADASQIPTYLLAKMARQSVTVALSGDGGDELFGGYHRYQFGRSLWRLHQGLPTPLRRLASAGLRASGPWAPRLGKLGEILALDHPAALYLRLVSHWSHPLEVVLGANAEPLSPYVDPERRAKLDDFTQQLMQLDLHSFLPDDILVKVDRAAMGVGLETRIPFLDHQVAALAWQLPMALKIRRGQGKWIVRQLLKRHLPPVLFQRPKQGFAVPIAAWLRGPLRPWAEELLAEKRLRHQGFFAPEPIRARWAEHLAASHNWSPQLWDVLMFQSWLETEQL